MHSNLRTHNRKNANRKGVLYVVATPIGNMDDITFRAVNTLGKVDIIAAEDTRNTGMLLAHFKIKAKLISLHEHNEIKRAPGLIEKLNEGLSVAIVSDAGTPSVSDPGFRLVREAISGGIPVIPVPGVSAPMTALSSSGLPADAFIFAGFPEKIKKRRLEQLRALAGAAETIIFFESPKRIISLIEDALSEMGDRYSVLCREMTKPYEEFIRGNLSEVLTRIKDRPVIKGECTLLVSGSNKRGENDHIEDSIEQARQELSEKLQKNDIKLSALSAEIALKYGISKKTAYTEALKIKKTR